jgi:DNA-binding MarR family transcriptional regulator
MMFVMKLDLSPETAWIVRDTCICYNLQRAARHYARRHDEALRPAGLTNGQFAVMMMMMRPHPPTITALAGEMAMDRTTLTALIKPLGRRRLVKATVDTEDRRQRRLTLTAEGRRVLEQALPLWQGVQQEARKSKQAAKILELLTSIELE